MHSVHVMWPSIYVVCTTHIIKSEIIKLITISIVFIYAFHMLVSILSLQCFDAVGWAAGRASDL